jgi:hypothetical protein
MLKEKEEKLKKELTECEILPDLTVPVEEVMGVLGFVQKELGEEDFHKQILIFALLYNIDDEATFMLRLAKTAMVKAMKVDVNVVSKP